MFERVGSPPGRPARRLRSLRLQRRAAIGALAALTAAMVGAGAAVPAAVAGAGPVTQADSGSLATQASALQSRIVATGQQLHQLAVATEAASTRLSADTAAVQRSQAELVTLRADVTRTEVQSRRLALDTYMGAEGGGVDSLAGLFGRPTSDAVASQAYAGMASDAMASAIDRFHRDQAAVARQVAAQAAAQADAARAYRALATEYAGLQQSVSQEQAMLARVHAQQLVVAVQALAQAAGPPAAVPVGALAAPSGSMAEDLARLRQCESGDDYRDDTGNGYYGAYQFSLPTWESLGYAGLPSDAAPPTQDQAAMRLEQRSGWGQWPACAAMLGLT